MTDDDKPDPSGTTPPGSGLPGGAVPRVNPLGIAAVILLALISYAGIWNYGYASDDIAIPFRLMRDGWEGIAPFLSPKTGGTGFDGYQAYFRPSWVLLSAAEYLLFGYTPGVPHVVNLLMYAMTCALVFHLVTLVTRDGRTAFWSALIFTIHPIHTMNVIWISGRTDGIATLGVLTSIVAALYWRESRRWTRFAWLATAIVAALVGLGGKEMAYLLPGLAVVTFYVRRCEDGSTVLVRLRDAVLTAVPAIVVVAMWGLWNVLGSPFVSGFQWAVAPHRVLTNLAGAVVLLFNPFDYETLLRVATSHPALLGLGGLTVTAAVAGGLWLARRDAWLIWGLAWLLIGMLPLYRSTMRWYLLLPSIGAAIVIGALIRRAEQTKWSRGATVVGTLIALLFATGLVRERIKWSEADELGRGALESLVELAGRTRTDGAVSRPIVLMASPHKLHRMTVFGGNTEPFLHFTTGLERRVDVVAAIALERSDAEVVAKWLSPTRLEITIAEDGGSFLTSTLPVANLSNGSEETVLSDIKSATVTDRNGQHRAVAIEADISPDTYHNPVWATFSRGKFVEIAPPPAAIMETGDPMQQAGGIQ